MKPQISFLALMPLALGALPLSGAGPRDRESSRGREPASPATGVRPANIVMIAGKPSHGPAQHEHNAGILLLRKCLEENVDALVNITHHLDSGWPSADELASADSIVIYADGQERHPALEDDHLEQLGKVMKNGCGLVFIHYAIEPLEGRGGKEFIEWVGGCFERNWSVNPHWEASFETLPDHPVSRGVKPFASHDEWYYHMRFRPGMKGITPILSDLPGPDTLSRPDGHHTGNRDVRAAVLERKEPQHLAWVLERDDGGRGFGFTGGHYHQSWANNAQRTLLLNAILWSAHVEVPPGGVPSTVTAADLLANLDLKPGQGLPPKTKAKP